MYWHYIAFQTAVALAIFDSKKAGEKGGSEEKSIPEVTEAHLAQVVSMSTAFKRYIKATHEGYEDADLAYKLGNRYDGLNEEAADWAELRSEQDKLLVATSSYRSRSSSSAPVLWSNTM